MTKQVIKDRAGNCLAIVIRSGRNSNKSAPKINFVTDEADCLQLASIVRSRGDKVLKHYHNPVKREITGTGEVLFIVRGIVSVVMYDDTQTPTDHSIRLFSGDAIILLRGGHSLTMETDVEMYEVKQGPYLGADDKTYF